MPAMPAAVVRARITGFPFLCVMLLERAAWVWVAG
jgi:hypothetical protein